MFASWSQEAQARHFCIKPISVYIDDRWNRPFFYTLTKNARLNDIACEFTLTNTLTDETLLFDLVIKPSFNQCRVDFNGAIPIGHLNKMIIYSMKHVDASVRRINDLKGKTIGLADEDADLSVLVKSMLDYHKVDHQDVSILPFKDNLAVIDALMSKKIDVAFLALHEDHKKIADALIEDDQSIDLFHFNARTYRYLDSSICGLSLMVQPLKDSRYTFLSFHYALFERSSRADMGAIRPIVIESLDQLYQWSPWSLK